MSELPRVPSLSVVIMAYNEEATLGPVCDEILQELGAAGVEAEVVVVDDGSTDATGTRADDLANKDRRVRVVHHVPNQGLGGVYRTGFREARGSFVTFFPADGQFPATIISSFLPQMGEHDMVLGYLSPRTRSLKAEFLSAIERLLYRVLLGPLPRFQGITMFRRTILDRLSLKSTGRGWAILMELVVRASREGYRILSVETPVRARTHGASKVNNLRTIVSNLRQLLTLRRLLRDA